MPPGPHILCTAQLQGAPSQSQQHKWHPWSCSVQPTPLHTMALDTSAEQVKFPRDQSFREAGLVPLVPAFLQNWLVDPNLKITWASSVLVGGSLCILEPLPEIKPPCPVQAQVHRSPTPGCTQGGMKQSEWPAELS